MNYLKYIGAGAGAAFVGAIVLVATPAWATPASGFVAAPVAAGNFGSDLDVKADKIEHWDLFLKAKDETLTGINKVTVQPGGHSGWHSHPIPIFLTVTAGEIQWFDGSDPVCPHKTYRVGDSFVEPANRIHNVVNATGSVAEFYAVRFNPENITFFIDQDEPTNCRF
jgi:quercetin dioxygenase-like cupin family protein